MKLRLVLYLAAGTVVVLGGGCFSVEYQTTVNRRGGGARTVEITMDPMMAGMYKRAAGSDRIFQIPGRGLQAKPEVRLNGSTRTELEDGSLKLAWDYRTDRVSLFTDGNDTVRLDITRSGIWVNYEYRETISASPPVPSAPAAGQDLYRLRHKLIMPGQILYHNSDSAVSGALIWNRSLGQVTAAGLTMTARSREINQLYLLAAVLLVLLAAAGAACLRYRDRQ